MTLFGSENTLPNLDIWIKAVWFTSKYNTLFCALRQYLLLWRHYDLHVYVIVIASYWVTVTGMVLGRGPANERRRYNVMSSFIGWAHTQKNSLRLVSVLLLIWDYINFVINWKLDGEIRCITIYVYVHMCIFPILIQLNHYSDATWTSNHRHLNLLFNWLFREIIAAQHYWSLVSGILCWPVVSPHKASNAENFSCHDIINESRPCFLRPNKIYAYIS